MKKSGAEKLPDPGILQSMNVLDVFPTTAGEDG